MRPIFIDLLRGMISGAIIAAGIGIGLAAAGAARAQGSGQGSDQGSGDIPGWDGFYVGLVAGPAFAGVDMTVGGIAASDRYDGVSAGILAGYGVVSGRILAGVEADVTLSDVMDKISLDRHKMSVVGRLGMLVRPELLVYGLAGGATSRYEAKVSTRPGIVTVGFDDQARMAFPAMPSSSLDTEVNKRLWGYTVGGGVEVETYSLSLPLRVGLEYRYTDFGDWDFAIAGQPIAVTPDVQEVRFRVVMPFN